MISKYSNQTKQINEKEIKEAAEYIKNGEIVLFPTETVYGLGANAMNEQAVKKIFEAKGRASDNPLIVHVSNLNMLEQIVENIGKIETELIQKFWPGPLTIIFSRKSEQIIPNITTANLNTVGVRMPSNQIAQKLIKYAGVPIAAPSANVSGKPSGTKLEDIMQEFDGKVAYMIDGGFVDIGVESTVIQVKQNVIHLLRPGKITKEQLEQIAPVEVDSHVLGKVEKSEVVASPGMKYRHYAPNTKCMMVYSKNPQKMIHKINEIIAEKEKQNQSVLVLGRKQHLAQYQTSQKWNMGETLEEVAKNIFTMLRQVDKENVDLVIIEGVGQEELGLAITNRLIRACEYHYIFLE